MLLKYALKQDWKVVDTYSDDDYSIFATFGTYFGIYHIL